MKVKRISNYNFYIWVLFDPVEPDRIIDIKKDKNNAYRLRDKYNQNHLIDKIDVIQINISELVNILRKESIFKL